MNCTDRETPKITGRTPAHMSAPTAGADVTPANGNPASGWGSLPSPPSTLDARGLPGTWLLSIQGAKVRSAQYADLVLYLLIAAAALAGAFLYRDRLYQWVRAQHTATQADSDNRPTRPPE
jgi:hypothetical protein